MTAHLLHAAVWLVVLAAQYLHLRGRVRRRMTAWAIGRWHNTVRTFAAFRRGVTFHPRQPKHAQERTA